MPGIGICKKKIDMNPVSESVRYGGFGGYGGYRYPFGIDGYGGDRYRYTVFKCNICILYLYPNRYKPGIGIIPIYRYWYRILGILVSV